MAGVGKLLKQAQKMQKRIEEAQTELAQLTVEVAHGGGAVKIVINGHSEISQLSLDPEFLKEGKQVVEATLVSALREAYAKSKEIHQARMSQATEGMGIPGLM
jgi:DNA-binding YbaB/EbfC family protein